MGNKIPASWFDDDPEWELLRHKAANRPVPKQLKQKIAAQRPQVQSARDMPRAQASKQTTDKEVVVNLKLALPRVKIPDFKNLYFTYKRPLFVSGGVLVSALVIVGAFRFINARQGNSQENTAAAGQSAATFDPLLPLDKTTGQEGKIAEPEYTFDNQKKVLGYSTEYNGAIITMSQQALPEKFKSNPGELAYVAKSIQANESIETQKGTAYIGTDEENKSQTAVFATKEVLVFIRANKSLDTEEWKYYINQLNPSR